MSVRNVLVVMGSAIAIALAGACIDPHCPKNYDQRGDTCYRKRDGGEDAATPDGGSEAADQVGSEDASLDGAGSPDRATSSDDAAQMNDALAPSCTADCADNQVCELVDGVATCTCAAGRDLCGADCVDSKADPSNCGSCGYRCEAGLSCKDGKCEQKIRELVLGGNSSCALYDSPDGRYPVKCWGDTTNKLFRDAATQALSPRSVVGVQAARALALAGDFQCAVLPDRDVVRCWGYCGLACGNSGPPALAETFFDSNVLGVARVQAGGQRQSASATCAIGAIRSLSCWGGVPMTPLGGDFSAPAQVTVVDQGMFTDLALGKMHACALTADKRVACWGANVQNLLGVASASLPGSNSRGVLVAKESGGELAGAVDLKLGWRTACAVTEQGELWCWGAYNGLSGSLGAGDIAEHIGAVRVPLSQVADVAIGTAHVCALDRGGQVYCWGVLALTGLGDAAIGDAGDGAIVSRPKPVMGLDDVSDIQAGDGHTCARRRSGQVVCWGINAAGQLGDGTTVARTTPTPVAGLY